MLSVKIHFFLMMLLISLLVIAKGYFFGELSFYSTLIFFLFNIIFWVFIYFCDFLYNKKSKIQLCAEKCPEIDLHAIKGLLCKFQKAVRSQNIQEIKILISPDKQLLFYDIKRCVQEKYYHKFILNYYSVLTTTLFPSIIVYSPCKVKFSIEFDSLDNLILEDYSLGEFTHYFIFEKKSSQWVIIDTNFCRMLRFKRKKLIFFLGLFILSCLLFILSCLLSLVNNRDFILAFLGF